MTLIEFQKAFDIIKHDIHLRKLSIIRFYDDTSPQFQSYLSSGKISYKFKKILFRNFKYIMCFTAMVYKCFFTILDLLYWYTSRSE